MSDSKLEFGKESVPSEVFYDKKLGESASKIVAERRAYAKFSSTGTGLCGAKPATIESANVSSAAYTNILSGPKLIPPPSLTSIDWSTDGANDIIDAYLWKATVNFVCYSPQQFEILDNAFFRHFNDVTITLGWINNPSAGSTTINGVIIDYNFSINEKLQYNCSVIVSGKHTISATGLSSAVSWKSQKIYRDENTKKEYQKTSFGGHFKADAEGYFKDNKPKAGKALSTDKGNFLSICTKENKGYQAFIPDFINFPENYLYYVSLSKIIETINSKYVADNFEGFNYYLTTDAKTKLQSNFSKSANPYSILNQYGSNTAFYNDGMNYKISTKKDIFINCDEIIRIESEIRSDKGDNPHKTKESIIQILKRICNSINESLGFCVEFQVIPYNQSGQNNKKWGFELTDRKTIISKKGLTPTKVNMLNVNSLVRSIDIQSNIDSEMAAIAQAGSYGGHGGKHSAVRSAVFGCNNEKPKDLGEIEAKLNNIYKTLLNEPAEDVELLNELVSETKNYWAKNPGKITGYPYGVTCTITVDGNPENLFGKIFTVSGLPTMLSNNNVYFTILKQGHKFDNGDWTMDLEGQMMFDM